MMPWTFLLLAMSLPGIGTFFYFVVLADRPAAPVVYGGLKLLMVLAPLLATWRWGAAEAPPRTRTRTAALAIGLGTGVVMAGGLAALAYGPLAGLRVSAAPHIAAKIAEFTVARAWAAHACCDAVLMLSGWHALGG